MASSDARQRSGETRRQRSREALIMAARERFAHHGWANTRVEDIAKTAHVGVTTAFNHFSKQTLLGHAYAPLITPLLDRAAADIADERPPTDAVARHIRDLARVGMTNRQLTIALLAAVNEQTISVNGPPRRGDVDDVRLIVPMTAPLIDLVAYGQERGAFRLSPSAREIGAYHTNGLMLLIMTRPRKTHPQIASLVLSQLLPGLLSQ